MPRTKTSITPLAGEVAAGDEVRTPPRDCQLDHDGRYTFFDTGRRSCLATKTSRRPAPRAGRWSCTGSNLPADRGPGGSRSPLHRGSPYTRGRCRCRGQRRRSRRWTVRSRRVTRSGPRRGIPSWTTTCRSTFFDTRRRSCLDKDVEATAPTSRPPVRCRKQSARR